MNCRQIRLERATKVLSAAAIPVALVMLYAGLYWMLVRPITLCVRNAGRLEWSDPNPGYR